MNILQRAITIVAASLLAALATGPVTLSADDSTNTPATGTPTISGTAQVHETLTAGTLSIADEDGMNGSTLNYQWFANDGERDPGNGDRLLGSFTEPEYVVQSRDEGDLIWVQVWFIDEGGTTEFLDSAVTAEVTAAASPKVPVAPTITDLRPFSGRLLSVTWRMPLYPYGDGGSVITKYTLQWKEADDSWDAEDDVSEQVITAGATTGTYIIYNVFISGLTDGVDHTVRVFTTNGVGDGPASAESMATAMDEVTLSLSGTILRGYAENGDAPVGTYLVFGAADDATITWSLTGDDSDDFSISDGGVLSFSTSPDYENAADSDTDNVYNVTVNASDGTDTATLGVTVTVTDEDDVEPRIGGL